MRSNRVHTWVRVRPSQDFSTNHIEFGNDGRTVNLHLPRNDTKKKVVNNQVMDWSFKVDGVFHNATQEVVYKTVAADLIDAGLRGYNGTVMCYGQTGAGKTFTMTGVTESFLNRGIIPRSLSDLYKKIESVSDESIITVRISYMEIYNEQMFDLLSTLPECADVTSPLQVVEDEQTVYVKNLSRHLALNEEEALNLLFEGEMNRATAAHILNKNSSRSHCIFTVYLETRSRLSSDAMYSEAKIHFVDLAGSERLRKTQSTGKTLQEASYINKSLSFLEQTVIALSEKNRDHIPFRQSKLTHFLKDSIGGGCKTVLIANVWGEPQHIDETASTLRFATRMMRIVSEPIENKQYDPVGRVLSLQREIASLKRELAMHDTLQQAQELENEISRMSKNKNNRSHVVYEQLSEQQKYDLRNQVKKYVEGSLDELDIVNLRQIQGVYESFRDLCRMYMKEASDYQQALANATAAGGVKGYSDMSGPSTTGFHTTAASPEKTAASGVFQHDDFGGSPPVGEVEAKSGFGVGMAPKHQLEENGAYLQNRRKEKSRVAGSPVKGKGGAGVEAAGAADAAGGAGDGVERRDTPPARTEAFEDFKKDVGSKIYEILTTNKEILAAKKQEYSVLAKRINDTKSSIDRIRMQLDSWKAEREAQGASYTEEGEVIITEEEFNGINQLRELKGLYKRDYDELKKIKAQVHQCQKMVELTRQRLIQEFDTWYCESFLEPDKWTSSVENGFGARLGTLPPNNAANGGEVHNGAAESQKNRSLLPGKRQVPFDETRYEDPLEKFDRVKHEHFSRIEDAEAYNRAKEAVLHREVYTAAKQQAQPNQRRPGAPVVSSKHQMPTAFEMHN